MSDNQEVNKLLTDFFLLERNTPGNKIQNITEEWVENCNEHMNFFIKHLRTNKNKSGDNEERSISNMLLNNSDFEQMYRMKRTTVKQLQTELNYTMNKNLDVNLLICLLVLGSTKSFTEIATFLQMNLKNLKEICKTYCKYIVNLSQKYVRWPQAWELQVIENGFSSDFKFPGVVGVIGNIHIAFNGDKLKPKSRKYYNENTKNHTIVVQAVCDNKDLFRNLHVGHPGSYSTEVVFKCSEVYKILSDSNNIIAKTKKHLLGGTAHPNLPTLLTPYPSVRNKDLTDRQFKFNLLHGSVMTAIEKTFRLMENRFPRIKNVDTECPEFATLLVGTICVLHNFCIAQNDCDN